MFCVFCRTLVLVLILSLPPHGRHVLSVTTCPSFISPLILEIAVILTLLLHFLLDFFFLFFDHVVGIIVDHAVDST